MQLRRRQLVVASAIAAACAAPMFLDGALAHGMHGDHVHGLKYGGPWEYMRIGAIHMLTGYDHLLFLFGVMFFLSKPADIVRFVTVFTLGHSITLIGGTLLGIKANPYLIDAVIALSVIYKAFENFDGFRRWIGAPSPSLLAMVGVFGLVHGFGLATRVQNYGFPQEAMWLRLLSFNIGVELGQIAALFAMVAALAWLRRTQSFGPFSVVANACLMIAGSLLFLHQLHGYQHNAWPDEFGFSTNSHILDHYRADVPAGSGEPKTIDMTPDDEPAKRK